MRKFHFLSMFLSLAFLLAIGISSADGRIVTVQVDDSQGNPIQGVTIIYNPGNGWYTFGTTDANGQATKDLADKTYQFYATYDFSTSSTQSLTVDQNNTSLKFVTVAATVLVEDCNNNPVQGAVVIYGPGYYKTFGTTGADGKVRRELLPGKNLQFYANLNHTKSATQTALVSATDPMVTFQTTTVNIYTSLTVLLNSGGLYNLTGKFPLEMFASDVMFRFEAGPWNNKRVMNKTFTIPACSFSQCVSMLELLDHNGNGLAGGTARGGYGNNYSTWFVPGSTDANGLLLDCRNGTSASTFSYEMRYNNTTQVISNQPPGFFSYQTNLLTLKLETCGGTGLAGGTARYGVGSTYTTWWFPGGATDASGMTSAEFFPGTYSFEMLYKGTADQKISVVVPNANTTLTWTTTKVTLHHNGAISYGGSTGDAAFFTQPSMELLPGTYKFHFRTGYRVDLAISSCNFEKTTAFAQLKDSNGNGLANADFKYRFGWGSYTDIGTDNTGNGLWFLLDGYPGNTKVKCSYLGASVEKQQNVQTNPLFIFNTVLVTADLKDSGGNLLTASSWDYRYGWGSYAPFTNTGMEMLPVTVKVRVGYKGATVEKEQNAGSSPNFLFNTVNVTADIQDVNGNSLMATSWDYRYGWGSYSPLTIAGEELLPVKVKVRVTFKGATMEKEQNVSISPFFLFNTVKVTADLKDGSGNLLTAGSWDYRYGWGSYSTLNNTGEELLPVNTKVKVTYTDPVTSVTHTWEKEQNVGSNSYFLFTYDGTKIRELTGETFEDYSALEIQIRPNPVRGSAMIDLAIPKDGYTQAAIYDLNGKLIHVLYDGDMKAGAYTFQWDAGGLTAGTYFCRLVTDQEMKNLRILLVD